VELTCGAPQNFIHEIIRLDKRDKFSPSNYQMPAQFVVPTSRYNYQIPAQFVKVEVFIHFGFLQGITAARSHI